MFKDTNLRSLLKELRTDIAMAVDDSFPLVYGLADKSIITEQLLKVRKSVCTAQIHTVSLENIIAHPVSLYDPQVPT